ncbi:hypothetical protein C1J03_10230 [Sulfitobacter sp. SK012]|nr:hypothetical protein C1J03_10230 [Sulfitobacter sp. SK012]
MLLFERWKCPLTGVSLAKMLRSARLGAMTGCTAASWEVFEVRSGPEGPVEVGAVKVGFVRIGDLRCYDGERPLLRRRSPPP